MVSGNCNLDRHIDNILSLGRRVSHVFLEDITDIESALVVFAAVGINLRAALRRDRHIEFAVSSLGDCDIINIKKRILSSLIIIRIELRLGVAARVKGIFPGEISD